VGRKARGPARGPPFSFIVSCFFLVLFFVFASLEKPPAVSGDSFDFLPPPTAPASST